MAEQIREEGGKPCQGTTYAYDYHPDSYTSFQHGGHVSMFIGGRSTSILQAPSRWPMLWDEPAGWGFTGDNVDPPSSAVPHSGGLNVVYGDGHVKYYRNEAATGGNTISIHAGDGLYPDQ